MLLVLDPTPNSRLSELKAAFERHGGIAFIGDQAWEHLEEQAGTTMATFVERYVRRPIAEVDRCATTLLDLYASVSPDRSTFTFRLERDGSLHEWLVGRAEIAALADGDGAESS